MLRPYSHSYEQCLNVVHSDLGGLYHLLARGNNGQAVYLTAAAYDAFLTALHTTRERPPLDWPWSGHAEYLGTSPRGLSDPGPVRGELTTPAQYEAFV
ncbi:MAG: hypothetical protein HY268_15370, partial [Deltaproteobacteria bacterium]|nr:hypothetical protein [Deltaproteobacteria bacterium]